MYCVCPVACTRQTTKTIAFDISQSAHARHVSETKHVPSHVRPSCWVHIHSLLHRKKSNDCSSSLIKHNTILHPPKQVRQPYDAWWIGDPPAVPEHNPPAMPESAINRRICLRLLITGYCDVMVALSTWATSCEGTRFNRSLFLAADFLRWGKLVCKRSWALITRLHSAKSSFTFESLSSSRGDL